MGSLIIDVISEAIKHYSMNQITRRFMLAGMLASTAPAAWAEIKRPRLRDDAFGTGGKRVSAPPAAALSDVIKSHAVSGTHSIVVADAKTGRILESSRPNKAIAPASVTKILTSIYALNFLGSQWRFQTRLVASSTEVINGELQGDLTLVGGGDPTLDTDSLARLILSLQARGITRIKGRFLLKSDALPYQRILDTDQLEYVGYNPSISGLNLNFNRVFFEWKRNNGEYDITISAKTKAHKPLINGVFVRAVAREKPVYQYTNRSGNDNWTVSKKAMGSGGNRWLPVRDPAGYAGETFQVLAEKLGVEIPPAQKTNTAKGTVIADEFSGSLAKLSQSMLRFSNNLMAETIGISATQKRSLSVNKTAESARAMSDWLRGRYGLATARLVDHSGLGERSKISANDMAKILSQEGWNGGLRALLKKVDLRNSKYKKAPISGAEIVAKTGSLNFTSALAGYIKTPSGRQLVFAIFTIDEKERAKIPKAKRDKPPGASAWARKSRVMQHQLIRRWVSAY